MGYRSGNTFKEGTMPAHGIWLCSTVLFMLAERSFSRNAPLDPDFTRNVSELISSKGYPVEEYDATTKDGYVIHIQRIPRGKNESQDASLSNKTTILLQHGMLSASSDFVINFPNQSLGFILADAGYDVWLGNIRGNTYSSHLNLTREERQFWDFSIDETVSEDLPSMIDTVLRETGKEKLQYVGWSQGALQMLALLSEKPEYNKKNLLKLTGKGQFLVSSPALHKIATNLCDGKLGEEICTAILFLAAGVDSHQTNRSRLNVYLSHDPAGTSVNNALHFVQLMKCDCFRKFDYGIIKNIAKYGKLKPPEYMLSRVKVPVAIYWSKSDWYATEKDVARQRKELSNVVEFYQVPEETFTHFDFGWGINAEPILYRKMMSVMAKYQT